MKSSIQLQHSDITQNIFDNTETAFAYKSDKELKLAHFLFSLMRYNWIVRISTKLIPLSIRWKLPVKKLIKETIFKQFVGGERLDETTKVIRELEKYNVKVIMDYGLEAIESEASFKKACDEYIRLINYASTQTHIPFISLKITALGRFALLEKLNQYAKDGDVDLQSLTGSEKEEWVDVTRRLNTICKAASDNGIGVMIDAEESWIQDAIDALAIQMMNLFNTNKPIVFNTYQLYRNDALTLLKHHFELSVRDEFILGAKLVRGAYMEKENKRATEYNYPSPIHSSKEDTDRDYDAALVYCIERLNRLAIIVATHNEKSSLFALDRLKQLDLPADHPHIHFSQLFGMSDNITFNLAKMGPNVSKYTPYGPVEHVIPYLMRRVEKNSSVSNQTGRELSLVKKELARRLA